MMWGKKVLLVVVLFILFGFFYNSVKNSQVVGRGDYRFNMAVIDIGKRVSFASFDPIEETVTTIPFPLEMVISSRTSGEYQISSLYKLGSYGGDGGKFARQKIQGFMRVPVPGYLAGNGGTTTLLLKAILGNSETSLSRLDALQLLYWNMKYKHKVVSEDELVRAGVIDDKKYIKERFQEYIGTRLFDWGIGGEEITVAIVNASGENGLGNDLADFLSNLGLDVVMVRSVASAEQYLEKSSWQTDETDNIDSLNYIFKNLFDMGEPITSKVGDEYRSKVLIKVGKDAKNLF